MAKSRGTYLDSELMDSRAFVSLGPAAHKVYLGLRRRWIVRPKRRKQGIQQYQGINDRELIYTYIEIQKEWEIKSKSTVVKAIDELVDKGLIDIVRQGAGTFRQTSIYGLSDRWQKWHPEITHRKHNRFVDKPRPRKPDRPGFKKRSSVEPEIGFSQVRRIEPANVVSSSVNRTSLE
jgi:hypothetical protein